MNLFIATRLRLTFFYILISYTMLALFTVAVVVSFDRTFEVVIEAIEDQGRGIVFNVALQQEVQDFKQNFISRLLVFDILIAMASGLASYILSGRTLRPIQRMLEHQQQFAADASHELRTPLANIGMEIAAHRHQYKPKKETAELLDSLEAEVRRMTSMVAGLLSLVRADSDQATYRSVLISSIVSSVAKDMGARFDQAGLDLDLQLDSDLTCFGHPDELRQLVMILLDNTLQYSHRKTTVTVKTAPYSQDTMALTVNNRGPVIPGKELSKVFQRFYRGQQEKSSGTGLGLAIAETIARRHRGSIAVASNRRQGTTFRVLLPTHD